jgi:hypothetical protein
MSSTLLQEGVRGCRPVKLVLISRIANMPRLGSRFVFLRVMLTSIMALYVFSCGRNSVEEIRRPNGELSAASMTPFMYFNRDSQDQPRRDRVASMMMHAWKGCKQFAWDSEELKPVSQKPSNWHNQRTLLMNDTRRRSGHLM